MLEKLEKSSQEAKEKKVAADKIEEKCSATALQIEKEKEVANKELEAAMPYVRAAETAANSINKKVSYRSPSPPPHMNVGNDSSRTCAPHALMLITVLPFKFASYTTSRFSLRASCRI
jgi:hypothetical protein